MATPSEIVLPTLMDKHLYSNWTKPVGGRISCVLLRGLVIDFRESSREVKLRMAGNGSEFDEQIRVVTVNELILMRGGHDVRGEEEHGPLTDAGVWSEPY
jgi:hypothetical protein